MKSLQIQLCRLLNLCPINDIIALIDVVKDVCVPDMEWRKCHFVQPKQEKGSFVLNSKRGG